MFSGARSLTCFHLGTALEKCGVLFCGIDKSLSLCNVALLSTVCHHLSFFEYFCQKSVWEMYDEEECRDFEFLERLEQRLQPEGIRELKRIYESRPRWVSLCEFCREGRLKVNRVGYTSGRDFRDFELLQRLEERLKPKEITELKRIYKSRPP